MNSCVIEQLVPDLVDEEGLDSINQLLWKLSPDLSELSLDDLCQVTKSAFVLVARNDQRQIVGMATLVDYRKLSGHVGMVEDVVVAKAFEGAGLGRGLMNLLIKRAREMNLKHLSLTSSPARVRAHRLYESLGFKRRDTNCFKLELLHS